MNAEVDLDHQAEVVFFRFLHCKITVFPSPYCTFWKEVNMLSPQLRNRELCLRWSNYINYLEFFCTGDLSILPHLVMYPIIYIRRTHGFLVYTLGYNLILRQLLCSSNCSSPDPCELFSVQWLVCHSEVSPSYIFFWNFLTF